MIITCLDDEGEGIRKKRPDRDWLRRRAEKKLCVNQKYFAQRQKTKVRVFCRTCSRKRSYQDNNCLFFLRYWQTRTLCCGHIVAHDVSWAAQTGKHLLRTQNVSEQNQKHFLCPGHKICVRNKCCARANGKHLCRQQCVLVCQGLIGDSCWRHCLHFCSFAYDLAYRKETC